MTKRERRPATVGKILSKTRAGKNLSIDDVVDYTRIRAVYVRAIEADNFEALPGGIYTRTYIRSYADFLGLDSGDLLRKLDQQANDNVKPAEIVQLPEPYRDEFSPSKWILIGSAVVVVFFFVAYALLQSSDEVPEDKHAQEVLSAYTTLMPTVVFLANEDLILTISTQDGIVLDEFEMFGGDTYFLPNQDNLVMWSSAPDGLEIYVNGKQLASTDNLEKIEAGTVLDVKKMLANVVH